jgi:hypothetical protein
MKRLTLLSILLLLMVVVGGTSARNVEQGTGLSDLTRLAEYAPEGTSVFAAMRVDDNYFDTLDGVAETIANGLDTTVNDLLGVPSVSALLESFLSDADINFATDVEPWLGDTLALYIPAVENQLFGGNSDQLPFIIALEITDQLLADGFVLTLYEDALQRESMTRTAKDGIIIYEASLRFQPSVVLTGDALILGVLGTGFADVVLPDSTTPNLADSDVFNATLGALPASSYDVVAYADLTNIIDLLTTFIPAMLEPEMREQIPAELFEPGFLSSRFGRFALGGFAADDRALVLDVVATGTFFTDDLVVDDIDLSLHDYLPSSTGLLVHGRGLGSITRGLVDLIGVVQDAINSFDPTLLQQIEPFQLQDIATFVRLSFEGTYGVEFDRAMYALDGDFLLFAALSYDDTASVGQINLNGLLRSLDAEATNIIFERAAEIVTDIYNPATFEDGELYIPLGDLIYEPDFGELLVTTEGNLIFSSLGIGDVSFARERGQNVDSPFTETAAYEAVSAFFLPDASSVLLVHFEPIFDVVNGVFSDVEASLGIEDATRAGNNVLETALITTAPTDGGFAIRFVLILAETD